MGNNISGLNPITGVTVEQILSDFEDWSHIEVLGSSRLFKVSKIKYHNGQYGVLKVFKYPEGSKTLVEKYQKLVSTYFINISNLNNVLPYSGCTILKDTVCLWRNFVHFSLSERLLTRPFLRIEEKKWIAFQILCGLTQCHKERLTMHYNQNSRSGSIENKLCHGDIKTENILITDWGWVFLADMAPFKPVYIPYDNPSEFYFYFDVSGRRACYVAPERFFSNRKSDNKDDRLNLCRASSSSDLLSNTKSGCSQKTNSSDLIEQVKVTNELTDILQPSMDMFSVGCVFIELFTDGVVPFNLADILNYRDSLSPTNSSTFNKLHQLLKKIDDPHIKELIRKLVSRTSNRITAEECLISQRGKTFPDVFYRDLKAYMVQFLNNTYNFPESRINKLYFDFPYILKTYVGKKSRHSDNGTLILFVNLITSVVFNVQDEQTKIKALLMLKELGLYLNDEIVLDRIIPYLLEFVDPNQSAEVRRTALDCAVLSVDGLLPSCPNDICFFPDYFLPAIASLQRDQSISIQYAFTRHIPLLARTADRFLQQCIVLQQQHPQKSTEETKINYDQELQHLWDIFREMIINLFASEQNVDIKCCVTQRQYLQDLTNFFKMGRARDDLLSHLITFLNDNTNYIVRLSFYRCMPDVIEIMGVQSGRILDALLIRGLQDSHLRVLEVCCRSLARAIRQKTLPHQLCADVLPHVASLFTLPYHSLRLIALDYLLSFSKNMSIVTVLTSFLKLDPSNCIFKIKDPLAVDEGMENIIWSNLHEPLSRTIFEDIIRCPMNLERFFNCLDEKIRSYSSDVTIKSGDTTVDCLFDKLKDLGLTNTNQLQIKQLTNLIQSMSEAKRQSNSCAININSNGIENTITNQNNSRTASAIKSSNKNQIVVTSHNTEVQYFTTHDVRDISSHSGNHRHHWRNPLPEAVATIDLEHTANGNLSLSGPSDFLAGGGTPSGSILSSSSPANTKSGHLMVPGSSPASVQHPTSSLLLLGEGNSAWSNLFDNSNDRIDSPGNIHDYYHVNCDQKDNLKFPQMSNLTANNSSNIDLSNIPAITKSQFAANKNESEISLEKSKDYDEIDWKTKYNEESKFRSSIQKSMSNGHSFLPPEKCIRDYRLFMPTAWRPKGILVGHLHEHRRGFTTILAHPRDKQMFSCGSDRQLKFWNCDPTPGRADPTSSKYIPNKSSHSLTLVSDDNSSKGAAQKLIWTDRCNSIGAIVDGRFINIVERTGEIRKVFEFPSVEYGLISSSTAPVGIANCLDTATENTLIYTTTGNWIVGHDLRCPTPTRSIFTVKQNNDFGSITCVAAHSSYTWLTTGTSRGNLVCWDMRFQRVINKIVHPNTRGFLSLKINPFNTLDLMGNNPGNQYSEDHISGLTSAHVLSACEGMNELSCWNIDSCSRPLTLLTESVVDESSRDSMTHTNVSRPSTFVTTPSVTTPSVTTPSVTTPTINANASANAIYKSKSFAARLIGSSEQRPCIISGSNDCHLRFWDLTEPQNCSGFISQGGLDQYSQHIDLHNTISTDSAHNAVTITQHQTHNTTWSATNQPPTSTNKPRPQLQPFTGHVASICDVTTINLGQPFIVSSSMDGIIKIWK